MSKVQYFLLIINVFSIFIAPYRSLLSDGGTDESVCCIGTFSMYYLCIVIGKILVLIAVRYYIHRP